MVSRWLAPNLEFLAWTGCAPTGRVETFFQLPKSEWSCPDEYPSLPKHPEYNNYMWWSRPSLGQYGGSSGFTLLVVGALIVGGVAGLSWFYDNATKGI